jgi:heme-degrading monooxygenase HmoA
MHIVLWEFVVPSARLDRFIAVYGPAGDWARLFRRAPGYLGTELLQSSEYPGLFLTVDRWESAASFQRFLADFSAEYHALDASLEGLSTSERKLGVFTSL